MTKILYATTNPGKLAEVKKLYEHYGIDIIGPADLGINIDVEETGDTLEANARLKADAYRKIVSDDVIIIADDTGVEIDALGGEPGIKVRRWKGYKMSDEEIIDYCLERLKNVPIGKRGAQFRTVLAMNVSNQSLRYFDGIYRGKIGTKPLPIVELGFPFRSLFIGGQPTHREIAVISTLPYLRQFLK